MSVFGAIAAALPAPNLPSTESLFGQGAGPLAAAGWAGFFDMKFMVESLSALLLAILLGAVVGYHPSTPRTVDTLREAEMPKVHIMFAFVGAVIGVTVREFGMVIGVVVFGIGGLIRFRTDVGSTRDTGRLIAVTLTGLIAGLGLPHLAVIVTFFSFVLIWLFDSHPLCRIKVDKLPAGRLVECHDAYRAELNRLRCRIISEHRSTNKDRLEFIFRLSGASSRDTVHAALCALPADVRGDVDWEVE
jgi:hypothetical protein